MSSRLKELKDKEVEVKNALLEELKESGLKSVKTDIAMVCTTVKKTFNVVDPVKLAEDLKERGLTDYVSELPNDLFKFHQKEFLKEGVKFEGTEIRETEYLTIKNNK